MPIQTTYTYSIASDIVNGKVNSNNLKNEISASAIIIAVERIDTVGDTLDIVFKDVLSATDKTILDGDITNPAGGLLAVHDSATIVTTQIVQISEEEIPTGGYFKLDMFKLICPANVTTKQTFSYSYPINLLNTKMISGSEHTGDVMSWGINPNTTIGALAASFTLSVSLWASANYVVDDLVLFKPTNKNYNLTYKCIKNTVSNEEPTNLEYWQSQNTTLTVSSTVVQYANIGFYMTLTDGVNTCDIGYVVNKTVSTITIDGTPEYSFLYTTPTFVQLTVMYMDNVEFGLPMNYTIGQTKIGSSYVPPGTKVVSTYKNNSNVDKTLIIYVEYLY